MSIPGVGSLFGSKDHFVLIASNSSEGHKQRIFMCLFKSYIATICAPAGSVVLSTQTPISWPGFDL